MELRSAAMLFFFSHTLQIVSPRVHGVKASGFKWI
jgi:ribosomal protein L5